MHRHHAFSGALLTAACALLWCGLSASVALAQGYTFSQGASQIPADGATPQTLTFTVANAAQVDQLRLMINYPSHAENGRGPAGYFLISDTGCQEVSPQAYGNPEVELLTNHCGRNQDLEGNVTFTAQFVALEGFTLANNNQVSGIWYASGVAQTGWRKLTSTGAGFDVVAAAPPEPASFSGFSFDTPEITANGADPQTLRLVLHDAADVDDVRLLINRPQQSENGRSYDGYFQWTPSQCGELGGGLGNDKVQVGQCEAVQNMDGSVEYIFGFTANSTFGQASNNQVSAIWYADGAVLNSWTRVTTSGAGFDVVPGAGPSGPPALRSFAQSKAQVQANGADTQTLRLVLDNAADVDDVRLLINRPQQSENGRSYDGYFQWTPSQCGELGGGLGNDKVQVGQCEAVQNMDGSVEYIFGFTANSTFGQASNNQVSAIWYVDGVQKTGWTRVTTSGAGFDVVGGVADPAFDSFTFDLSSVQANGAQVQTLRLVLDSAANVDDVRVILNRPQQSENGRSYDGYFQWTPSLCGELGGSLGNDKVTVQANGCQATARLDGSVEYTFPFTVEPSFGVASNNQVSAIWYVDGVQKTGWRRVTGSGEGFAVVDGGALVRNACGGFGVLSAQPGQACGPGNLERWICQGSNSVVCDVGPGFVRLSAGDTQACAIRASDGQVQCWGRDDWGEATPPSGAFVDLDAGYDFTCGVRSDGTLACWGLNEDGRLNAPTGSYTQVSAGARHACALRQSDSAIVCWGSNLNGEASPPSGVFQEVSAGDAHSCGLRSDGTLACWGLDNLGEASPPSGTYTAVSAGTNVSCAIRASDRRAVCWGLNSLGQAAPPSDQTFAAISAGLFYSCGVTTGGQALCWGTGDDGQASPAAGDWQDVTQALRFACGLRPDGSARCWGQEGNEGLEVPRGGLCGGAADPGSAPGSGCGPCGLDIYYCSSTSATSCSGQTYGNACDGCGELDNEPGDACGRCGLDEYVCAGPEATACDGDTPNNVCGGCGGLVQVPGDICGGAGRFVCDGQEDTSCSASTNICGGANPIQAQLGQACQFQGASGFLACYGDRGLVCSVGYVPFQGELEGVDSELTNSAAGDLLRADLNSDGYTDLISGTRVYLGPFAAGQTDYLDLDVLVAFGRVDPVGDLNGDGHQDVLVGNRDIIYGPITSSAQLQSPDAQVTGFTSRAGGRGDVNGDGNDDLVMINSSGAWLFYGPLSGSRSSSGANVRWLSSQEVAVLADINKDGREDLVVERCLQGSLINGSRQVTLATAVLGPPSGTASLSGGRDVLAQDPDGGAYDHGCSVLRAAGDSDGDGFTDLAMAQPTHSLPSSLAGRVVLIEGGLSSDLDLGRPEASAPAGVRFLVPTAGGDSVTGELHDGGDFDGDGDQDLIFLGFDYVYTAAGARLFDEGFYSATGGDFDGDGFADLAVEGDTSLFIHRGAPASWLP